MCLCRYNRMGKSSVVRDRAPRGIQCGAEYANVVIVHGRNLPILLACQMLYVEWVVKAVCSDLVQDALRISVRHEINCPFARLNTSICGSSKEGSEKDEICFITFVCHSLQGATCGYRLCLRRFQQLNRNVQSPFARAHGSSMPPDCTYAVFPHSARFPVAAVVGGILLRRPDVCARRLLMSDYQPAFRLFSPSSQRSLRPSSSCPCRPSSFCDPSCAGSTSKPCTLRRSG